MQIAAVNLIDPLFLPPSSVPAANFFTNRAKRHRANKMTKYFRVKNWDRFQHYKDRNPPWIKLHNHLLDDYEFELLSDATKGHLLCIWMLASRTNNKLPYDQTWIKRKIGANSNVDLKILIDSGFIELQSVVHDASVALDSEEKRRDREEAEERREDLPPKAPVFNFKKSLIDLGCDEGLVSDWLKVRAKKKAANTERALKGFLKEVDKTSMTLNQVLEKCVYKSWSGFEASWVFDNHNQPQQLSKAAQQTIDNLKDL